MAPGEKLRILFVDDEPDILHGIRNRIRKFRDAFDGTFLDEGQLALNALREAPFDVVVTDMRMPVVNGTDVLRAAHSLQPHAVRIVLSGHADLDAVLRVVPVAHRFLTKPCDPDELFSVILRARTIRALVGSERVRKVIGGVRNLPPAPVLYAELTRVLSAENAAASDVAAVLRKDVAMTAKVLQLVNSAFLRSSRKMTSVEEAVRYLGFDSIKSLVLGAEIFGRSGPGAREAEAAQAHGLLVGTLAATFFSEKPTQQETFLAGMMHDIGRLVIGTEFPEQAREIDRRVHAGETRLAAEGELVGATHCEIGAYLLSLWGLPESVVEATAYHHAPAEVPHGALAPMDAVHAADALLSSCTGGNTHLDAPWLEKLGAGKLLDEWRARAERSVKAAAA